MANQLPQNIVSEMNEQVTNAGRRINLIENKADEIDKEILNRQEKWRKDIAQFNYELSLLKKDVDEMKKEFKFNIEEIKNVIDEFRASAKKSSFDELKKKIDNMDFENLITRKQFEEMLNY